VFQYGGQQANISFDDEEDVIGTKINALSSITSAGGVVVSSIGTGMYRILFNQMGVRTAVSISTANLNPTCNSRIITLKEGSAGAQANFLVKITQTPCVYQAVWEDTPPSEVTVETLITNQAKRVSIRPYPKTGTWYAQSTASIQPKVNKDNSTKTTPNIPLYWTQLYSEAFSINALDYDFKYNKPPVTSWEIGYPKFQANVSQSGVYTWDFYLTQDYTPPVGYTFPLTINGDGVTGFAGKTSTVSFNTAEIEYLLNGASSATATLEIEIEQLDGSRWTVLQETVTIVNGMIDQDNYDIVPFDNIITEAPQDGKQYVRKDGAWAELEVDGGTY
jgi:hypothetical protein